MSKSYLFTSESVSEGHADKIADQVSDAILDAILAQEPRSRVACETMTKTGMVVVAGEITTNAVIEVEHIVRQTVLEIGYDDSAKGFDGNTCAVLNALGKQSLQQLMGFKGIGEAKAITIAAAMELGRRRRDEEGVDLKRITSSRAVFEIMQPIIGELPHEEFWVLYLNNSNKVICKTQISKGGITGTLVDTRLVFQTALEHYATSVILIHNHPSGKLQASDADKQITRKLIEAGKHLDILVLDHIIVTEKSYFSFADEGIL